MPVNFAAAGEKIIPFIDVNFTIFDHLCMQLPSFCDTFVTSFYDNVMILVSGEEFGIQQEVLERTCEACFVSNGEANKNCEWKRIKLRNGF
jgi:hypothetical protein